MRTRKSIFVIPTCLWVVVVGTVVTVVTIMMISSSNNNSRERLLIHPAYSMMILHPGIKLQKSITNTATTMNLPCDTRNKKTSFFRCHKLSYRQQSPRIVLLHLNQMTGSTNTPSNTEDDNDLVPMVSTNTSPIQNTQNDNHHNHHRRPSNTLSLLLESVTTKYHQPQLIPHSFAGMVERQLMEQFSYETTIVEVKEKEEEDDEYPHHSTPHSPIERILQSWRLLEQDYIHEEYIGHHDTDHRHQNISSSNNNTNDNNMAYQSCHSYVPGLTVREFWDVSQYDWCQQLASKYEVIRKEFLSVISNVEYLQTHGNNVWATALDTNVAKQYGSGWSTLVLMNRGIWDPQNVQLFPQTSQIIYDCHIPAVEIFFASMQPNSTIPYHSDYTNFVLTSHLGIDIPNNGMNQCRLNVGGTKEEQWLNGKVMIFDTSIMHNAINECTDQVRYILMMRIWHPDLTKVEQQALQYIYDTLEFPELITATSIEQRTRMEQQIQQAKTFPLLPSKTTTTSLLPGTTKRSTPLAGGFGTTTAVSSRKKNKKKGGR